MAVTIVPGRIDLLRAMPRGGVVAEIGVAWGDFSTRILDINKPKRLLLVDCWDVVPESHPGQRDKNSKRKRPQQLERYRACCRNHLMDSRVIVIRDDSIQVARHILTDKSLDWLYLDSNHFYKHARKELPVYWDKIKPGGWLMGDDYVDNEWSGVKRAVTEFLAHLQLKLDYLTAPCSPLACPNYAVRKPKE